MKTVTTRPIQRVPATPGYTALSLRDSMAKDEPRQQETAQKLLLTVNEAAQRLSIGRPKMWQLVMTGEVLSIKIGASRRIPVVAIETYVERLCASAEAEWHSREEGNGYDPSWQE